MTVPGRGPARVQRVARKLSYALPGAGLSA